MKADGIIRIFTDVDTSGIQAGTKQIESSMTGVANKIKRIGGIIAAAFAVKKVVQFGKECLELGSDLQEVQNVVDSVFTTMSDKVDEFAKSAAVTAGLSETMAKRYTGTFGAMAKAFNFTEDEAFEMSKALTQLSGDVASFYNITQDEAYTKLKSVFTGETESLKELGVVMTQSALDQFALANGYGKTTAAMSEQEKVALRYRFVMQQLSTASGDFIRTSNGWANQVRILKLQFESLKATIGQGLINIFTPVIKVINLLLAKLATVANAFKAFTELITGRKSSGSTPTSEIANADAYNNAADGVGNIANATQDAADATKEASKANKGYISGLDEIKKFSSEAGTGSNTSGANAGAASGAEAAVDYGSLAEGETVIDEVNESFSEFFEKLKGYVEPLTMQLQRFGGIAKEAFGWLMDNVLRPLGNYAVNELLPRFFQTLANVLEIVNNILIALQPLWQWFWDNVLQPIATWTGGMFLEIWDKINEGLKGFAEWCKEHPKTIENITIVIASFFAAWAVVNIASKIAGIINSIASFVGVLKTLSSVMGGLPAVSTLLGKAIGSLVSPAGIAVAAIGAIIAVGVLLWKNWDEIKVKAKQIWENIKGYLTTTWSKMKNTATEAFNKIKSLVTSAWENIRTKTSNVWNGITNIVSSVFGKVISTVTNASETIKKVFSAAFEAVAKMIKTPINGILGVINGLIRGVVSGINLILQAFNKLNINIPSWVPGIGGRRLGFNFATLTAPQIPYLATGAVIPPNSPFMAVLGDQRNGNNIETPEALLRKIVREETGNNDSNYRFVAQINRRTLFDEMITEGKIRQASTGLNPFELA